MGSREQIGVRLLIDAIKVSAYSSELSINLINNMYRYGIDPNFSDEDGDVPIVLAAFCAVEIVEKLIDLGADVNLVDGVGRSAIAIASAYGKSKTVKLLIDRGSDVNVGYMVVSPSISSEFRLPPILVASINYFLRRDPKSTRLLLEAGAVINNDAKARWALLQRDDGILGVPAWKSVVALIEKKFPGLIDEMLVTEKMSQ